MSSKALVLLPELVVALAALAALGAGSIPNRRRDLAPYLAVGAALVALALEAWLGARITASARLPWEQDRFALYAKLTLLLALALALAAADWESDRTLEALPFAYLAALAGLGAASASSLPGLWLAVAVGAGAGLAATGARLDPRRLAAPLAGALLSAAGMAWLAVIAGTPSLAAIGHALAHGAVTFQVGAAVGLTLAGLGALLGLAPFHVDAGERSLTAAPLAAGTLAGLSAGAAGFAAARLLGGAGDVAAAWWLLPAAAGVLAVIAGGLLALEARGARQLVSRLGLAQVGWFAIALSTHDRLGTGAALLVLSPLVIAAAAGPAVAGRAGTALATLTGLGRRSPARAAALAAVLLSLAAVPPLAGFFGEFTIAAELARSGSWVVLALALAGSIPAMMAALRAVRTILVDGPPEESRRSAPPVAGSWLTGALLTALVITAFAVLAHPISDLAAQGAAALNLR